MSTRMSQNSETKAFRPEVKLLSMTENPIGTIFALWYGSRHKDTVLASDIQTLYESDPRDMISSELSEVSKKICKAYPEHAGIDGEDYRNVIYKIVSQVVEADLPPTESVLFTFEIDKASVAWREQLVRSKFATYWTQTSRTQDLTTMDVTMNDSIEILGGDKAVDKYKECVQFIRDTYKYLVEECGVPMEDIRLQPQGHLHRVYWMINLRSLIKILNKRSDWIAQASLWTPINAGVCAELQNTSIMSIMRNFIGNPLPTVERDSSGHVYVQEHPQTTENEDRFYGRDPLPCDPLWLAYEGKSMPDHTNIEFYDYLKSMYIRIWKDEYLEVLGWDRNNPKKLGKYDRPLNWSDKSKENS